MKTIKNDIKYLKDVKELLITIDMVNGFVKEGALATPSIKRIIPKQIELLEDAIINLNTGMVFIRDSHKEDAVEFNTYEKHCIEGTKETEIIDELKEYAKYSLVYKKNSTNLIFVPGIQEDLLKLKKLKRVILMGCLAEICVKNGAIGLKTFFDEMNKDIDVCVYSDAIDTYDSLNHNREKVIDDALKDMKQNGIKIL